MNNSVNKDQVLDRVLIHLIPEREKKPHDVPLLVEADVKMILNEAQNVFSNEKSLLRIKAPIMICGDIHGQYFDLLRLFEFGGYPPQTKYLFLGDYVDRGKYSIESVCLLMALKLKYPGHIYLLRGNHEDASLNRVYGFYDECKRKYNVKLWKTFLDCFEWIPVAALISDKILCMHGGLSPSMQYISQIDTIQRPCKIPDEGILCDLMWADPEDNMTGWGPNERGVSFVFGADVVKEFVERNGIDLVCRAHQVVQDGYEFFADKKLVTVFSAPNYCGEFDNSAGMLQVSANLLCTLKVLEPKKRKAAIGGKKVSAKK